MIISTNMPPKIRPEPLAWSSPGSESGNVTGTGLGHPVLARQWKHSYTVKQVKLTHFIWGNRLPQCN